MSSAKSSSIPARLYIRTFAFVRPYWVKLLMASVSAALYAFLSALMIWLIGPLMSTLFKISGNVGAGSPAETSEEIAHLAPGAGETVERFKDTLKGYIAQLVQGSAPGETLFNFCLLVLAVVVLKNFFNYMQGFLMVYNTQAMMRDVRNALFDKYQALSFDHFHMERTGSLISRVTNDVNSLNQALDLGFNRLVADVSLVIMLIGILLVLSVKLTLMAAVALPASLVFIYFIGNKIRKYSGRSQEQMADVTTALEENISNFRIVKAFGTEEKERKKFHSATWRYFKSQLRMGRISHLSSPINDTLATIAGLAILLYAGSEVIGARGEMDGADFLVFIIAMFALIKPAKSLATTHARLQEGMAAAERILGTLDKKPRIKEAPNAKTITEFRDRIEYRDVRFHYPNGPDVIKGVTFTVERGEVVALVGPSGGGKSTLLDLLPRFYDPQDGAVLIDGIDVRELTLDSLRSLLGVVTQETYLFNDTVAGNIGYGVESYTEAELIAAAKAANAHEFISEFPDGYNTIIGNRGVRLSGGQRQRISIARALLRNPQILIFDEATSALDTESEALVQEAIDRLMVNRTALVVAHRLSTIINADKILVVDDGRIVESGKHEELLARDGAYRRLHDMQYRLHVSPERAATQ